MAARRGNRWRALRLPPRRLRRRGMPYRLPPNSTLDRIERRKDPLGQTGCNLVASRQTNRRER